jgi:hypothetical protein
MSCLLKCNICALQREINFGRTSSQINFEETFGFKYTSPILNQDELKLFQTEIDMEPFLDSIAEKKEKTQNCIIS